MITAKIVKHSKAPNGQEIVTFELEYPRFIHSEMCTHRVISKNSASSRAIPVMTMIKGIWNNTAAPIHWGKNQAGMAAKEELVGLRRWAAEKVWNLASKVNCGFSYLLFKIGAHKQISNRITEPFSHIKIVATATTWDNFYTLRDHEAAQPEIQELAKQMLLAYSASTPRELNEREWHLPYVDCMKGMSYNDALRLSASLCAQTSYRKADDSMDKAHSIFGKLVDTFPIHFSPTEHQARPLEGVDDELVTHVDKLGRAWSGNFCGWGQYRQKIQLEKKLEIMTCKVS